MYIGDFIKEYREANGISIEDFANKASLTVTEIEALEKENDTIDKQKEMEEKLLAVEEARQKLQNAMTQKTLQVYRERSRLGKERCPTI